MPCKYNLIFHVNRLLHEMQSFIFSEEEKNRVLNVVCCGCDWRFMGQKVVHITKTRLYNFDPLKPHFYIVKLGFTGVYIIFLVSAQNIDCGYSLEPPRRGGSNEYPQSMFCRGGSNEYPQSMF